MHALFRTCLLGLLGVSTLGSLPATVAQAEPPMVIRASAITREEAADFAVDFASSIAGIDERDPASFFDFETLAHRAVQGVESEPRTRERFRRGLVELTSEEDSFLHDIRQALTRGGDYVPIRLMKRRDDHYPLFRLGKGSSVSYHEFVLERRAEGLVIGDIYVYTNGELLSETYRQLALLALRKPSNNWLKRMAGIDHRPILWGPDYSDVQCRIRESDYQGTVEAFAKLPRSVQSNKPMLLNLCETALESKNAAIYSDLYDRIADMYPNDPMLDQLAIVKHVVSHERDEFFAAVDRLDARVGGDAYLDLIRSDGCHYFGDSEQARDLAHQVVLSMPYLQGPKWALLDISLATRAYDDASAILGRLEDEHGVQFRDPRNFAQFNGFVTSAAGAEWLREHESGPPEDGVQQTASQKRLWR